MSLGAKMIDGVSAVVQRAAYREVDLLGHSVRTRVGARRSGTDYDDGWTLCLLQGSRAFADIGCNVGHVSLLAAVLGVETIVAVDANRSALAVAAETLALNGYIDRVRFASVFVSDAPDEDIEFFTVGTGAAGSRYASHATSAAARGSQTTVRTTTLDRLVGDARSDLVKVDVEGAEIEVLRGATQVAAAGTKFLVEMHSRPELPMHENGALVLEWCRSVGYDAYYLKEHRRLVDVGPFKERGRCHLLLQPSGSEYPRGLDRIVQSTSYGDAARLMEASTAQPEIRAAQVERLKDR